MANSLGYSLWDSERQWQRRLPPVACRTDERRHQETGAPEPKRRGPALPCRGAPSSTATVSSGSWAAAASASPISRSICCDQRFAIKEYYPRQFASREHMTVRPTTIEDAAAVRRVPRALPARGAGAGPARPCRRRKRRHRARADLLRGVRHLLPGDGLRRGSPASPSVFRQEPGGLAPPRVRSLLTQLLSSIRVVHRAGLVHRDIKPANVILREGDRLVLIDFGATRQATPSEATTLHPDLFRRLRTARADTGPAAGRVLRHLRDRGGVLPGDRRHRWRRAGAAEFAGGRAGGSAAVGRLDRGRTLSANVCWRRSMRRWSVDAARRPQSADAMLGILRPGRAGRRAERCPRQVGSRPLPPPRTGAYRVARGAGLGTVAFGRCRVCHADAVRSAPPPASVGTPVQTATVSDQVQAPPPETAAAGARAATAAARGDRRPRRRWPCRRCPPSRRPCRQLRRPPRPHRSTRRRMWPSRCPARCCVSRPRGMASARPVSRPPVRTSIGFSPDLRDVGYVADDVTRVDRSGCSVLDDAGARGPAHLGDHAADPRSPA